MLAPNPTVTAGTRVVSAALARLAGPEIGPGQPMCDPAASARPGLHATPSEPAAAVSSVLSDPDPAPASSVAPRRRDLAPPAQALSASGPKPGLPDNCGAEALGRALAGGEIGVHYQPVVRIGDRRPVLVEALARWHRPGLAVPPAIFVALAERTGLARDLAATVARTAFDDMGRLWPRLRLGVSVNLPLAQLVEPDLPCLLGRLLGSGNLGPAQVSLELTETTPVQDRAQLRRALVRLRAAGFRVLLDDVVPGDGRAHLHGLPFAGLKLDRSLVERLPASAAARQDVLRLVRLARPRGQSVIAEGVAGRRTWAMLRNLGVTHAQGYGIGRPCPASALPDWWARWRGWRDG